jgi:site-specific recombinase
LSEERAQQTLGNLSLLGPSALFAAYTGVLLFASSIVAGWTENWFVLLRLESALRYNPRIVRTLGALRAERWAHFGRENISGLAANVSLGLMLGMTPAFAGFFGLGLDARHVTLTSGQIGAATLTLGWAVLSSSAFWWAVAFIPINAMLNVGVSFYLAFLTALRAQNVSVKDRHRIYGAIRARLLHAPLDFFWPTTPLNK